MKMASDMTMLLGTLAGVARLNYLLLTCSPRGEHS